MGAVRGAGTGCGHGHGMHGHGHEIAENGIRMRGNAYGVRNCMGTGTGIAMGESRCDAPFC